jgi:hypothetical protein
MKTMDNPGVDDAQGTECPDDESADKSLDELTQRLNVRVSPRSYERLLIHAIKLKRSPGELMDFLIREHLKRWKVQANNPASARKKDRPKLDGPVIENAPREPAERAA